MNLNQLKPTYWTDQQTGEQIGPMYSWNDIREMQLNECMAGMQQRAKTKDYTVSPVRLTTVQEL